MTNVPRMPLLHKNCKCCTHPDINTVDTQFLNKEITQMEAASKLGVTPAYYSVHINRDIKRAVKEKISPAAGELVQQTVDKMAEIRDVFSLLLTRCKSLLQLPLEEAAEQRIKAIASEVRQYGELIARIEGELHDSPLIQINQLNMQYNKLTEVVMETVCPICRSKLMTRLQEAQPEQ